MAIFASTSNQLNTVFSKLSTILDENRQVSLTIQSQVSCGQVYAV